MCCTVLGKLFWKTKIPIVITLLVLSLANILQLLGVVSPEWDMFDTPYFGSKIRLYQNLWTIHDEIKDKSIREGLLPQLINTEWKAGIVRLEVSALVTGVLALVLIISTNVTSMRQRILVTCYVLAVLLACSSAVTAILGVQNYKKNYKSILSIEAFHSFNMVPTDRYALSWGWRVSYASGTFFLLSAVLIIVNIIKSVSTTAKSTSAVSPSTSGSEQA